MTIGSIIAVTIRWCEKAASAATHGISTRMARASLRPAARLIQWPMRSVTPVALRPAAMTKTEATMIAGSLVNPANASAGSSRPVNVRESSTSIAVTSTRGLPRTNSVTALSRIRRKTSCALLTPPIHDGAFTARS